MEYNKSQFEKSADKKVLHKVRKHWVVMSTALLMMLGGVGLATQMSAHADVNGNPNNGAQTLKNQLNDHLKEANQQTQPDHTYQNTHNQTSAQQNTYINQQANQLHQRILENASFNSQQNNKTITSAPKELLRGNSNYSSSSALNPVTQDFIPTDPHNDHSGIQSVSNWGTANCTLFNDNLLYVRGGTISNANNDNAWFTNMPEMRDPSIINKAVSVVFSDVTAPTQMIGEFEGCMWWNLLYLNGNGLNVTNTTNMGAIFDDYSSDNGVRWYQVPGKSEDSPTGTYPPVRGLRYIDVTNWNVSQSVESQSHSGDNLDDNSIISLKTGPYSGAMGLLWTNGNQQQADNPSNWVNSLNNRFYMNNSHLPADTYYYVYACASNVKINYIFGNDIAHPVYTRTGFVPKELFAGN